MANTNRPQDERPPPRASPADDPLAPASPEDEAAVERGERIATGKNIARGGKPTGDTPGATGAPPWGPGDNA